MELVDYGVVGAWNFGNMELWEHGTVGLTIALPNPSPIIYGTTELWEHIAGGHKMFVSTFCYSV